MPYPIRHKLLRTDQDLNEFANNSVRNKMMKDVNVQITINNPKLIEMTDTHTLQAYSTAYKVYI